MKKKRKKNNNNKMLEDVPLVGVYIPCIYTHARRLVSLLLYLCYVFRALVNSLVC